MVAVGNTMWSSRFAFVMASVGFAVGLGNIWRFPYVTGENGGSAFVVIYLLCALAIGIPCLMAELLVGRRGGGSPPRSMAVVAQESGRSKGWSIVGGMGVATAYTIAITYAVVVGWVLWYLARALSAGFAGFDAGIAEATFTGLLTDNQSMMFWTLVGNIIVGSIIYAGVTSGIERAVTIMMPLMFALLVGLSIYNYFAGGFVETLQWLFTPDFSKVTGATFLAAIGQAFFSIGVGMGGMMTYGAYLPRDFSIARGAATIVMADTLIALLAGFVVFPAVFHFGLDMASGPGLIFQTLPVAFAQMPGGAIFAVLFFIMLAVAGVTSMVGLLESVTSWTKERLAISRQQSALLVVGSVTTLSVISVLSYNVWESYQLMGLNFNELTEALYDKLLLPLAGLLVALFTGWFMHREFSESELVDDAKWYGVWRWLTRFVAVPAVAIILISGLV
ncbi:sodium-dependent transporter [Luminiphilus sp.]|jgi:neurotransmitter:Na+ symporter, NSS family|nr:sodium-dependent transporter [Luminiphilus sp.]